MLVNGKLIPPPELGDALDPDEPGYRPPVRRIPREYLTAEQWDTLREAARVESCAVQQLAMLDAANRMSAAGGRLARDFFELHARGGVVVSQLEKSLSDIEAAAESLLVASQELRFQANLRERDIVGGVLNGIDFSIANKRRALDWHARTSEKEEEGKEI